MIFQIRIVGRSLTDDRIFTRLRGFTRIIWISLFPKYFAVKIFSPFCTGSSWKGQSAFPGKAWLFQENCDHLIRTGPQDIFHW